MTHDAHREQPPSVHNARDHNPATRFPHSRPIRANQSWRDANHMTGWAMTEKEERLARDRAEIAARVANFKETQRKFEREREEYYATTLGNAWSGYSRSAFWS
jgi:hypothetical protein